MDNDNYVFALEQALTKLLEEFEPETFSHTTEWVMYNDAGDPCIVGQDLSRAIDHATEILYGDACNDD